MIFKKISWSESVTQALVSVWNSQQLWNTVQRKRDTQLRRQMLNKCKLLLHYFLLLDQSKNELELVKHQDSKKKINTGSVSITSYELKVLKWTNTKDHAFVPLHKIVACKGRKLKFFINY